MTSFRQDSALKQSARSALLWGSGFSFGRDLIQFASMLALVRLLSPDVYGRVALAQSVIGFLAIASLKTFSQYPLQARNPEEFDWDSHFTVGALTNIFTFVMSSLLGLSMWLIGDESVSTLGSIIAFMSPIFLFEIASTYHGAWLSAHHMWARQRILLLSGSIAGACVSILFALAGFGVFALASSSLLFSIPVVVDFIFFAKTKPSFKISYLYKYGEGFRFALNRVGSAGVTSGRAVTENAAMAGLFSFALLGSFSRAFGLAQITSGRVGALATQSLYAVLTRAEKSSDRFQRFSALLLQGVVWASLPAAAFVGLKAAPLVSLLYGHKWGSVAPMLPAVCVILMIRGISGVLNQVMLANLQGRDCFKLDIFSTVAVLLAIPVFMQAGLHWYLNSLIVLEILTLIVAIGFSVNGIAMNLRSFPRIFIPSLAATIAASCLLFGWAAFWGVGQAGELAQIMRLLLDGAFFFGIYFLLLLLINPQGVSALLEIVPIGSATREALRRWMP